MDQEVKNKQPQQPNPVPPPSSDGQLYGVNTHHVQAQVADMTATEMDLGKTNKFRKPNLSGFAGAIGLIQLVIGALFLAFVINQVVFQSYEVFGSSMEATLSNGDRLIISKVGRTWSSLIRSDYLPARGDIIVFNSTVHSGDRLVKRVIGLPGDKVVVEDGSITIFNDENPDGFDPDVDYEDLLSKPKTGDITTEVTEGHVFVSGDNRVRGESLDSRNNLGLVPVDNIIGNLVMRAFPLGDARIF